MPSRMDVLRERAKPSRGSLEHQQLKTELGGVEPGPDHPRYEDFIRLTDPRPMGRPVADEVARGDRPKAGTPEYNGWWRKNTPGGQTSYGRQRAEQMADYHFGPYGSGSRQRADQRARQGESADEPRPATKHQMRRQRTQEVMDFYDMDDWNTAAQIAMSHPEGELPESLQKRLGMIVADSWEEPYTSAAKTKKPAKPRAPEEVWYDVHKHPEGVPGGMGKSPEHHLKNRGWTGHEINSATGRTMQYLNPKYPHFVISFGGGTPQKPDHNFRILYMGDKDIPKKTLAYQPSEAMNKVEELHRLHSGGLVVQPMTHGAALETKRIDRDDNLRFFYDTDFVAPVSAATSDQPMIKLKRIKTEDNAAYSDMDDPATHSPKESCETCYLVHGDETAAPDAQNHNDEIQGHSFKPFRREPNERFSTVKPPSEQPRPEVPWSPELPKKRRDMTVDDFHPIGKPKVEFPTTVDRESDYPKKRKPQLKEIPDPPKQRALKPDTYMVQKRSLSAFERAQKHTWEES